MIFYEDIVIFTCFHYKFAFVDAQFNVFHQHQGNWLRKYYTSIFRMTEERLFDRKRERERASGEGKVKF